MKPSRQRPNGRRSRATLDASPPCPIPKTSNSATRSGSSPGRMNGRSRVTASILATSCSWIGSSPAAIRRESVRLTNTAIRGSRFGSSRTPDMSTMPGQSWNLPAGSRLCPGRRRAEWPGGIPAWMSRDSVRSNCRRTDRQSSTCRRPGVASRGGLPAPTIVPSSWWLNIDFKPWADVDTISNSAQMALRCF